MVTTNKRNAFRIAHLEREQKQERLDRVEAAIDEVSHENVVGLRAVTADAEQLHEIIELSVDVATNLHASKQPLE